MSLERLRKSAGKGELGENNPEGNVPGEFKLGGENYEMMSPGTVMS